MLKFVLTMCFTLLSVSVHAQETVIDSLPVGNFVRSYQLYLPTDVENLQDIPVVFNYHGLGSNAFQQAFYSSMNLVAEEEKFIVVYPQGWYDSFFESTFWNMGFDPWLSPENLVDDVEFTRALIDLLDEEYEIDQNRMYATGMSMGGMFSYWVSCHMSNKITAVASVAGALTLATSNNCPTSRAVPLMQIHGTDDDVVPWEGATLHESIPESIEFYLEHNDCPETPVFEEIPDINTDDGTTSSKETYGPCIDNSEVVLITVQDGEHTWPGSSVALQLGATSQDFDAAVVIWDFFKKYKLDDFQSNTAIEEIAKLDWSVYSANGTLHIQLNQIPSNISAKAVRVFDGNGRLIRSEMNFSNSQKNIDLRQHPMGIYFVELLMENGASYSQAFLLEK